MVPDDHGRRHLERLGDRVGRWLDRHRRPRHPRRGSRRLHGGAGEGLRRGNRGPAPNGVGASEASGPQRRDAAGPPSPRGRDHTGIAVRASRAPSGGCHEIGSPGGPDAGARARSRRRLASGAAAHSGSSAGLPPGAGRVGGADPVVPAEPRGHLPRPPGGCEARHRLGPRPGRRTVSRPGVHSGRRRVHGREPGGAGGADCG